MTVREGNMENVVYRFCYIVSEHIMREEGGVHNKVVFRRLKRSRAAEGPTIHYGYASVEGCWRRGCGEYVGAARKAGISTISEPGWVGVHHVVIHEVAHVLQFVRDGEWRGHGKEFAEMLHWLSVTYQLSRCLTIAGLTLDDAPDWGRREAASMPKSDKELVFVVKMREKRQAWSWRLQRDGYTVNIAIGLTQWNRISNPRERMLLIKYIKAEAARRLRGVVMDNELRWDYEALQRRLGWR